MTEHIELLKKEISALKRNLKMAEKRHGVREEEILNIQKKLVLKHEIIAALVARDSFREGGK